jgi:hypothetical protein
MPLRTNYLVVRRDGTLVQSGDALADVCGERVSFMRCTQPTKVRVKIRPGLELERPARVYAVTIIEDVQQGT